MRILLCSVPFAPSIGGIESVSSLLAASVHAAGHEVVVITRTPSPTHDETPWTVVRRPSARELLRHHRWADVVFHNNISLRWGWPLLLVRRPWVVAHHTWLTADTVGALKRLAVRAATNIAVSRAVASSLPVAATVIANPYDDAVFRPIAGIARARDIAFVGRLVSDKGAAVLLDAIGRLRERGVTLGATLIGDGPEAAALRARAVALGIDAAVSFAGALRGDALARALHTHRLCVVPSMWEEPFGLVAIEALACGCVPIVARSGGLPDAIGSCGLVFPKGDVAALAATIEALLQDAARRNTLLSGATAHLARHRPVASADRYIEVLRRAARDRSATAAQRA